MMIRLKLFHCRKLGFQPSLLDPLPHLRQLISHGGLKRVSRIRGIVLSAKYTNTKSGITVDPVQQFQDHFNTAFDHFALMQVPVFQILTYLEI